MRLRLKWLDVLLAWLIWGAYGILGTSVYDSNNSSSIQQSSGQTRSSFVEHS